MTVLEPDKDDMKIENATSKTNQIEAQAEADVLLKDACESLRKGNSKEEKEIIEQYLRKYNKDPYWDNLNGIMSPLD
ncbi:MAG: hypothetical protein JXR91_15140 [Deltaproteobacteria bacterium]|nr:hypothetical protein [Deltaproteobacteria bacterium]